VIAIAFSGCNSTTTTSSFDDSPTSITVTYPSYYPKEEYEEEFYDWVAPLTHKPPKGTFRQSRGSYKGISKSAKGKFNKLNRKRSKKRK